MTRSGGQSGERFMVTDCAATPSCSPPENVAETKKLHGIADDEKDGIKHLFL